MRENQMIPSEEMNHTEDTKKKTPGKNITTIVAVVIVVQVVLAVLLGIYLFRRSYNDSKNNTSEKIRKDAYNAVYEQTEKANHVSNRVSIVLTDIQEKAELEVLEVESNYIYTEKEVSGLNVWYRIPGTGTFTVDLRMTQFIVDGERLHVLVKAPAPAITQFRENMDGAKKLLYQDDRFLPNGSVREGEGIALRMLSEARVEMIKSLEMNQGYYQAAKESAATLITSMIRALNPKIEGLTIEVVFNDDEV